MKSHVLTQEPRSQIVVVSGGEEEEEEEEEKEEEQRVELTGVPSLRTQATGRYRSPLPHSVTRREKCESVTEFLLSLLSEGGFGIIQSNDALLQGTIFMWSLQQRHDHRTGSPDALSFFTSTAN